MGAIRCARCGAMEDESAASFSEHGLVCARCHGGAVSADVAAMHADLSLASAIAGGTGVVDSLVALQHSADAAALAAQRAATEHAAQPPSLAHAELLGRGATVQRAGLSRSVSVGVATRASAGYAEAWTLPSPPAVQASFTPEGLADRFVKLFRKELQTGDPAFDAAVYVRTETPEATAALLARPDVRGLVGAVVARGGTLAVRGNVVAGEVLWPEDEPGARPQDVIAQFVGAVLATG